jgi:hypothetical protein
VISYLGQYGGTKLIPPWVDLAKLGPTSSDLAWLGAVAAFSLLICAIAVRLRLPTPRIIATIAADQLDTPPARLDPQNPTTPHHPTRTPGRITRSG